MLYLDQIGQPVVSSKSRPGVGWVRMTTDIPAAFFACLGGDLDFRSYLQSLKNCSTEAVFSAEDPVPGLVEMLLMPYLAVKRGF